MREGLGAGVSGELILGDGDFPVVFRAADTASIAGQRRYMSVTKWRLVLAVLAAVGAAFSMTAAVAAVLVAFVGTVCLEVWMLAERPEQSWYDGRALAESTKTLAWRYAVAGKPFPAQLQGEAAARKFHERLEVLLREAPVSSIAPVGSMAATDAMNRLRDSPFQARKDAYLKGRIEDQQRWYGTKAALNTTLAHRWRLVLIAVEGLGVVAAALRLLGWVEFDLPGVLAAVLGAGAAWFAVRQYEALGRAYTFAATELSIVHQRLTLTTDEAAWSREVADAEEAISREHTMWRAARGTV
ncbi:DUF4231 domain-containing protein [Streptomyces sp. ISL-11]|uniref:DUF4231 domain-containing protein n=1 Tax=Streptomyces sp. ISL-11 TaxID=2819174 RepID=UPI0020360E1F|nr:DUF4231 domain-containing protein [Streptomyces sp. ISL-11]